MNDSNNHIELFDRYVSGDLDDDAKLEFENRLLQDSLFSNEYELFKESLITIETIAVRNEVRELLNQVPQKKNTLVWKWIGVAASISIVFLISFLHFNKPGPSQIFKTYYKPYHNVISVRNDANDWSILNSYSNQQYEESIRILSLRINNDTAQFYLGLSHLSLDNPIEAQNVFEKIDPSTVFSEQIIWYSSLADILLEDNESAIEKLKKIEPKDYNYEEARELIDLLE